METIWKYFKEAIPSTRLEATPFRLLSLPPGPVLAIVGQVQGPDIGNLRLSCRQLSELLQPQIFQRLRIYLSPALIHSSLFKLRSLATATSPGCKWTKHLDLGPLNNIYTPLQPALAAAQRNPYPSERQYLDLVQEALQLLPIAVTSLRSLVSFRWDSCGIGSWSKSEADDLIEVVAHLPTLRSVEVKLRSTDTPPPFRKLKRLVHASFIIAPPPTDPAPPCQVFLEIRRLVSSAPHLQAISIHDELRSLSRPPRSLDDLVATDSATSTTIRQLCISGSGLRILSPLGGALAHLKSLTLSHNTQHAHASANEIIEGMEEFWRQWNKFAPGIFLEELNISHVPPPSLVQYLCSYSGLRILRISGATQGRIQVDRSRFWNEVLAKHSATLQVVQVQDRANLPYESYRGVTACRALRELMVTIAPPLISRGDSVANEETAIVIGDHLAQILEDAHHHLPRLHKLVVVMPSTQPPTHPRKAPPSHRIDWMRLQATSVLQLRLGSSGPRRISHYRLDASPRATTLTLVCRFESSETSVERRAVHHTKLAVII